MISLCIRAQLRLYRRFRGGKHLFHRILSIVINQGQDIHTPGCGFDKCNFALANKEFITETESSIHCAMVNCRSVVDKTQTIEVEIATHNIILCALTETWLKQGNYMERNVNVTGDLILLSAFNIHGNNCHQSE